MTDQELKECVNEIIKVIDDYELLTQEGYTYKDMLDVNAFQEIVLLLEYWKIREIPTEWLEYCIKDVSEDEYYSSINTIISDMWLEKANKEIEENCAEIEKATD